MIGATTAYFGYMSAREQYDPILDSIADGVFTVDGDWHIRSFNRAAESITGVKRAEAIGRKCWEVFRGDICERDCALKQTMNSGRSVVNQTVRIIDARGRTKPISVSTALLKDSHGEVSGGVETFRDLSEIERLRRELLEKHTLHDIVTADHAMRTLFDTLPAVAQSDGPVLVLGESGTGKELLARAIHDLSRRAGGPFVAVNCGALPDALLESELFGYRKGAFTDARADKPGRFDRAQGGTLFLDEIGELTKAMQVKLLRVLQDKSYEPLGATRAVKADVRVVAATNQDISACVDAGTFRRDLYYRINMLTLRLPPLRERRGDIPLLVEHFVGRYNAMHDRAVTGCTPDALAALMRYDYPGNVRELENIIHRALILCVGTHIGPEHLPAESTLAARTPLAGGQSWEQFDVHQVRTALEHNRHSRIKTARELGIHPATLWRKMKKYGIS